jgi:hypothetical protein
MFLESSKFAVILGEPRNSVGFVKKFRFSLDLRMRSNLFQLQFCMNFSNDGRTNLGDYVHQVPGKAPRMIVLW